ncbi:MAG TPA: hypothetical protein PLK58_02660 [Candidatus Rifleibacterium sp.]|jgi:hypothetical protein|nr:hypothetical protein [Candidatus Rifleibacterium sp.]HPW57514.1 hypothetical protein [Candidatus Rifleibacterium sp.]
MLWFFAFTTVGIAIFALFLALRRMTRMPFLQMLGGTAILSLCGWLATRAGL